MYFNKNRSFSNVQYLIPFKRYDVKKKINYLLSLFLASNNKIVYSLEY